MTTRQPTQAELDAEVQRTLADLLEAERLSVRTRDLRLAAEAADREAFMNQHNKHVVFFLARERAKVNREKVSDT